jgi:hypothetical protein
MPAVSIKQHVVEHVSAEHDEARRLLELLAAPRIDIADGFHLLRLLVVDQLLHIGVGAKLEFRVGQKIGQDADVRRRLGVGFAAEPLAVAAIFAGAERQSFRVDVDVAGVGRRRGERVVADALAGRLHDRAGHGLCQRLVRIFVLARPFEHVAAGNLLAAQVARLAGDAADLFEVIVIRFELVIADREILDCHFGGNGVLAVAHLEVAAQIVVGRHEPPCRAVPV